MQLLYSWWLILELAFINKKLGVWAFLKRLSAMTNCSFFVNVKSIHSPLLKKTPSFWLYNLVSGFL